MNFEIISHSKLNADIINRKHKLTINEFYLKHKENIHNLYNDSVRELTKIKMIPKYIKKFDFNEFVNLVYHNSYQY